MAFSGKDAAVFVGGTPLTFTQEATTTTDSQTFKITDVNKGTWDQSTVPIVEQQDPGSEDWEAPTVQYKLNYLLGSIVFSTALAVNTKIRVSGKYVPLTIIADATQWDLSLDVDMKDVTRFRSEWKQQVPLIRSGSCKFSRWWVDPYFSHTVRDNALILALYTTQTTGYKCVGYLKSDAVKSAVDDVVSEDVGIDVTGSIEPF